VLAVLLAAPGCARGEEAVTTPDIETRLVLRGAAGKEAKEFRGREPITLVVTIRNRGDAECTLTLPTSQTHDCIVHDAGGREVWRWSAGRMFAQVLTELTLAPGASRTFTSTWDLTDRAGAPLPPGDYRAVGLVPARVPGARSDPVPFAIRPPEPGTSAPRG
jgi:hypothetical protein